jgi:hypothetical protein
MSGTNQAEVHGGVQHADRSRREASRSSELAVFVVGRFVSHFNSTLALARPLREPVLEQWLKRKCLTLDGPSAFITFRMASKACFCAPRELWVCAKALRGRTVALAYRLAFSVRGFAAWACCPSLCPRGMKVFLLQAPER